MHRRSMIFSRILRSFVPNRTLFLSRSLNIMNRTTPKTQPVNLRQILSPVLLGVHPDLMLGVEADLRKTNEESLQVLNSFIDIVEPRCNSKSLSRFIDISNKDFYIHFNTKIAAMGQKSTGIRSFECQLKIPAGLSFHDNSSTEVKRWRKFANESLRHIFEQSNLPIPDSLEKGPLASSPVKIVHASHNRKVFLQSKKEKEMHDKLYIQQVAKQTDEITPITTGMEYGSVLQHKVFCDLLRERILYEDMNDKEKRFAFKRLANIMLSHFHELSLHSMTWNRVIIVLSASGKCTVLQTRNASSAESTAQDSNVGIEDSLVLKIPFLVMEEVLIHFLKLKFGEFEEQYGEYMPSSSK